MNNIYKYLDSNHILVKNQKLTHQIRYSYVDKFLKDMIFVVNSGLLNNSFMRINHLRPSDFSLSKKISYYKKIANKFDVFYIYPIYYAKKQILQTKLEWSFYSKFYARKQFVWTVLKYKKIRRYSRKFINLLKGRLEVAHRWNITWKSSHYVTFNGGFFRLKKKYLRLKARSGMFRGDVKVKYRPFIKIGVKRLKYLMLQKSIQKKEYLIYDLYLSYLYKNIIEGFKTIKGLKKNGPFFPYYGSRKKLVPKLNFLINNLKKRKSLITYKNIKFEFFVFKLFWYSFFNMLTTLKEEMYPIFILYFYNSMFIHFKRILKIQTKIPFKFVYKNKKKLSIKQKNSKLGKIINKIT